MLRSIRSKLKLDCRSYIVASANTASIAKMSCDLTPSFPPAGIRAGRLFCA